MRIALFVEDAAHAEFVEALLRRLLDENGYSADISIRNAVGGRGAVLAALRSYVRDLAAGRERFAEILAVAIDGNCQGAQAVAKDIREVVSRENFPGWLVVAVPNPHIELWYLADGHAVFEVIGAVGSQTPLPTFKCERGRYKALLRDTFRAGEIDPPAGGSEYGADVALALNLELAGVAAPELMNFVTDVRSALRECSVSGVHEAD